MEKALDLDNQFGCSLRDEFIIPTFESMGLPIDDEMSKDSQVYYLCGNSLGCMPKNTRKAINDELDAWGQRGVESHFRHPNPNLTSWVDIDLPLLPLLAPLVGAKECEVAVMGSLTSNLNNLLISFYKPSSKRYKILFEKSAFPSDFYAFYNQSLLHKLSPDDTLLQISPREGEHYLRTEDILSTIEENKDCLALVCFPGIQYYSGQLFDIEKITKFTHQFPDIIIGWDLAHAVGNVILKLHEWDVDFACWCSYKYLNSGPGAMAGIFVNERFGSNDNNLYLPRLAGWWGNSSEKRFQMLENFEPISGALGFRQSNPSVIDVVSIISSLRLFRTFGGIATIRQHSIRLTSYLLEMLQKSPFYSKVPLSNKPGFTIITPIDSQNDHGAQLSLLFFPDNERNSKSVMDRIFKFLHNHGVIVDERRPDVIRIAPVPLYNTFMDVYQAVRLLNEAFNTLC